ncbi:ArnT family glycosyltransferase [Gloeobacter morelensis]|uniref:Phospholipid carrier-dependent glycosyltransferase n=1 Tax=Gloeobacter morelensis MG652769 TaxID=2781736 RepID=A0ABY3PID3_9CYAN|nr:phospholipid carrier-dependent glycosyltransferase [Gloeobacter morelensis]UFP93430.1 phospholipid carrier-dependent glycosyltransferase [Gloeobacter morelensis MG652769]
MASRLSNASRPVAFGALLAMASGVFGLLLAAYLPFIGSLHLFDWDELIFAEAAREMVERNDYLRVFVNYVPFFEKPPGFFWLQALSFHWFGVSEGAARLPSAIFTAATGALVFLAGSFIVSPGFGLLWAALFGLGILPAVQGKLGLIDPTFNFFVLSSLVCLFAYDEGRRSDWLDPPIPRPGRLPGGYLGLASLCLGFAVLVKGPLALAIVIPCFAIYKIFVSRPRLSPWSVGLGLIAALAVAGSWFALETLAHGPAFVGEFVTYQLRITGTNDGHPGVPFFHTLVFLLGCFPFSIFLLRGISERAFYRERRFQILAMVLFVLILLLFEVLVKTKLIHYASLLQVPGAFLAARVLYRLQQGKLRPHPLELAALVLVALALAAPMLALPYIGNHPALLEPYLGDPSARAYLDTPVDWGWLTYGPGLWLIAATLFTVVCFGMGRGRLAVAGLLATGGVTANLVWIVFMARVDAYVSTPQVQYIDRVGRSPLAFYGPLTYLPPFYARRQVANPRSPEQLARLLRSEPSLWVVARQSEVGQIASLSQLKVQNRYGAYLLLGPAQTEQQRDDQFAFWTPPPLGRGGE